MPRRGDLGRALLEGSRIGERPALLAAPSIHLARAGPRREIAIAFGCRASARRALRNAPAGRARASTARPRRGPWLRARRPCASRSSYRRPHSPTAPAPSVTPCARTGEPAASAEASAIAFGVAPAQGLGFADPLRSGPHGVFGRRDQQRRHEGRSSAQRGRMKTQVIGDERAHEVIAVIVARALAVGQALARGAARFLELVRPQLIEIRDRPCLDRRATRVDSVWRGSRLRRRSRANAADRRPGTPSARVAPRPIDSPTQSARTRIPSGSSAGYRCR